MGGGVGGGSSDAATTLMALNQLWNAGLSAGTDGSGLPLGADIPFSSLARPPLPKAWARRCSRCTPDCWYVVIEPGVMCRPLQFLAEHLTRDTPVVNIADFSSHSQKHRQGLERTTCNR
jgi:4-diphosphocytidyl-2-C-methyl-D-erythritol kinase